MYTSFLASLLSNAQLPGEIGVVLLKYDLIDPISRLSIKFPRVKVATVYPDWMTDLKFSSLRTALRDSASRQEQLSNCSEWAVSKVVEKHPFTLQVFKILYLLTRQCVSALVSLVHFRYCLCWYGPPALELRQASWLVACTAVPTVVASLSAGGLCALLGQRAGSIGQSPGQAATPAA